MKPCIWKDTSGKDREFGKFGLIIRAMPEGCKKMLCDGLKTEGIMKECGIYVPNNNHIGRCRNGD
jgi:hypothetical protein